MRTADFDFELPPELIAQVPAERRDASRLLVLDRVNEKIFHESFRDVLKHFRAGDVLVLNNSRVIPARLRGVNEKTGGQFEVLLLEENSANDWWVMLRPGKRARVGTKIIFRNHAGAMTNVSAEVIATNEEGHRRLRFCFEGGLARNDANCLAAHSPSPLPSDSLAPARSAPRASAAADSSRCFPSSGSPAGRGSVVPAFRFVPPRSVDATAELQVLNILDALDELGELPLPPYIERAPGKTSNSDLDRYQTVFAQPAGSVAAPTAGLHFTPQLLDEIRAHGVHVCFVTLHVGLGTFAPVKADLLAEHVMHEERFVVSEDTANVVNRAKREGRRVIAVGTTSVRVLESASDTGNSPLRSGPGRTSIFIHPPHRFKIVDALLTNFHLPRSTLLMLVSAFAAPGELRGRELALNAYAEAVRERYRFFSYGDAMLIL